MNGKLPILFNGVIVNRFERFIFGGKKEYFVFNIYFHCTKAHTFIIAIFNQSNVITRQMMSQSTLISTSRIQKNCDRDDLEDIYSNSIKET
ncbi:hypothetical protein BpHYR1_038159 [Brachionus plicatilis]|uniref:Uncharacterized protein n=1 Tax=Brachionus plicatilis TaxID=10195 RepID=A0A3M7Q214_BRAPC|nr:hypothetical protein BpHYR1_038159 [Brachionus plicatilis]